MSGAGFMARTHAEAYAEMDVDVVVVASPSGPEEFVEELGFDAETFTDTATMCEEGDIDYLDVCTPTHTHLEQVRTAADAGVDVFLEKPIAGSLEEAAEIADLVDDADLTFMVGHVVRFSPSYAKAKDLDVGTEGVARARRLSPFPDWGSADWFADREKSGGVFVDLAIHDLDYLRWCWGEVERVFARRQRDSKSEHGFVTLRFESGAVGYVEASWAQPESRPLTMELEFAGDDGLVEYSSADESPYREWIDDGTVVESPFAKDAYRRQLEHFVSCVDSGDDPTVGAEEAIEALRLALAAERSAERGQPVSPAEVAR
ncbi:Gfo/Idh/MocA family oxidoreductase [Natronoglomus mannanivorans]|uniref:Gfo/Idh/MocA family oxidoreductase n=1 Tax=Natronoglomus mannanivorans TaxID=2979990 RepID=A0AAP2Z132_9EURY|nr:Gfo/Idh/MocA family oxidoreductase [Halobacteria archaeon AArc-xg1-1]